MASSRERMFTASQVCRLLDEDSNVSSNIEIEVKILNICVGCHDVYLFLQSDMPCHSPYARIFQRDTRGSHCIVTSLSAKNILKLN